MSLRCLENCSGIASHHHCQVLVQVLQKDRVEVLHEMVLVGDLQKELDEVQDKVLELD